MAAAERLWPRCDESEAAMIRDRAASVAGWRRAVFRYSAAAVACVAVAAPMAASAQTVSFVLSRGDSVELPALASVGCDEIDGVTRRIDDLRYRTIGPTPPSDPGDRELYDYEEQLSKKAMTCRPGMLRFPNGFTGAR